MLAPLILAGITMTAPGPAAPPIDLSVDRAVSESRQAAEELYWVRGYFVSVERCGRRHVRSQLFSVYATSRSEAMQFGRAELSKRAQRHIAIWNDRRIAEINVTEIEDPI